MLTAVYLRRVRCGNSHRSVAERDLGSVAPVQAGERSCLESLGAALPRPLLQPRGAWGQLLWRSAVDHHHHLLHIHPVGCTQLREAAARRRQGRTRRSCASFGSELSAGLANLGLLLHSCGRISAPCPPVRLCGGVRCVMPCVRGALRALILIRCCTTTSIFININGSLDRWETTAAS